MYTKDTYEYCLKILNGILNKSHATVNDMQTELIEARNVCEELINSSEEDLFRSILRSHKVICEVKQMDEKAAYGQNPALYYSAAVSAESGECLNKIIKALRNGDDPEATKNAVISELPDIIVYSAILAHVLDLNLTQLVNEKVRVVIDRALSGYYGGPLNKLEKE